MKKRITFLALFLALLLALNTLLLTGCGHDNPPDTQDSGSDTEDTRDTGDTGDSTETDPPQPVVTAVDKTLYMTGQPVSVTVRKSADLTSDAVAYLNFNEPVHVFETIAMPDGDVWAHVDLVNTYGEKVTGYLILGNLSDKPAGDEDEPEITETDLVRFIARTLPSGNEIHTLNVRSKPSFEASAIGTVNRDQQVRQIGVVKQPASDGTTFAKIEFTDEGGDTCVGYVNIDALVESIQETDLTFKTTDLVRYIAKVLPSGGALHTLNVHVEPTLNSKVVGSVARDQEVHQIAIANSAATTAGDEGIIFAKIEFTDPSIGTETLVGYVNAGCLAASREETVDYDPTGVTLYAISSVNLREQPSRTAPVVTAISQDEGVFEIGRLKEADSEGIIWSYVEYKQAGSEETVKGYVSSKYLAAEKATNSNIE